MESIAEPKPEVPSSLTDTRSIPLDSLRGTSAGALRRIVPAAGSARILVAAFNASL